MNLKHGNHDFPDTKSFYVGNKENDTSIDHRGRIGKQTRTQLHYSSQKYHRNKWCNRLVTNNKKKGTKHCVNKTFNLNTYGQIIGLLPCTI